MMRSRSQLARVIGVALLALLVSTAASARDAAGIVSIARIQGAAHVSPLDRERVTTRGIVTVVAPRGFYLESDRPDTSPATSEGLYVDTYRRPDVRPGDLVEVTGRVAEEYPGGPSSGNLPVTMIKAPEIAVVRSNVDPGPPVVIGSGGRVPPGEIISNDADGLAEESPFDPVEDGLDFYESLEGMRVRVNDALSVGTVHTAYGEIWVVPDAGAHASVLTARGGIVVRERDFNPDRILVDYLEDELIFRQPIVPSAVVGDRFTGPIEGVVSYSWGNYKILPIGPLPEVASADLPRETVEQAPDDVLAVAAFNVQNLSGRSPQAKFDDIAATVVRGLGTPDIVMLSEVQDSDGPTRSETVDSDLTAERLLDAIGAAGGPADYRYVDIAPEYNADGGQPHANIRVGFLYRSDRVSLVAGSLQRVAPGAQAFANSRKPLAADFVFRGRRFHLVANHFSSKGGDGALFGRVQPPTASSEQGRWAQARAVREHVDALLAEDPDAYVIVGGDLNDFAFSRTLEELAREALVNLADPLPAREVYSYIYEGNAQALDHILVSRALAPCVVGTVDYVHRYAEYLYEERHSDHDPVLAWLRPCDRRDSEP